MARIAVTGLLLPFLIPLLVFGGTALVEGMSLTDTFVALVEQCTARRQNLLICGVLGWVPLAGLFLILFLYRLRSKDSARRNAMAWAGIFAISLVIFWSNLEFWPNFLPSRVYPGFPHGLELVIGPLFFAPVAVLIAVFATWLILRAQNS